MPLPHSRKVGMLLATAVGLAWACSVSLAAAVPRDFGPLHVVWGRYAVHVIVLLVLVWPRQRAELYRTARPLAHIGRGLLLLLGPLLFVFASLALTPDTVWAVFWAAPVVAMVIAALIWREPATTREWLVALFAYSATVLAFLPVQVWSSKTGILYAVGCAVTFGLYQAITRRLRRESTWTGLFYAALCVFVPTSLIIPFYWQPPTLEAVVVIGAMGLTWGAVLYALDESLKRIPLAVTVPFIYTKVIWTIFIEFLIWQRLPSSAQAAGAAAVLLAAAGTWHLANRNSAPGGEESESA